MRKNFGAKPWVYPMPVFIIATFDENGKAEFVNAPIINELPMTIECRMTSYDEETCHLFADIINVSADEKILTDGKIDISKLRPIAYDPVSHAYVECSQKVGNAFKDGLILR